ncbi:hypothetical protein L1887_37626 [Cichorium endivia]|nr:hypothetical protein L1887_37626 [Cichorium endivia]
MPGKGERRGDAGKEWGRSLSCIPVSETPSSSSSSSDSNSFSTGSKWKGNHSSSNSTIPSFNDFSPIDTMISSLILLLIAVKVSAMAAKFLSPKLLGKPHNSYPCHYLKSKSYVIGECKRRLLLLSDLPPLRLCPPVQIEHITWVKEM